MKKQVMIKRGAPHGNAGVVSAPAAPYAVGSWAGRANYECGFCAYATLEAGLMLSHLRAAHGITAAAIEVAAGESGIETAAETAVIVEEDQGEVR